MAYSRPDERLVESRDPYRVDDLPRPDMTGQRVVLYDAKEQPLVRRIGFEVRRG